MSQRHNVFYIVFLTIAPHFAKLLKNYLKKFYTFRKKIREKSATFRKKSLKKIGTFRKKSKKDFSRKNYKKHIMTENMSSSNESCRL